MPANLKNSSHHVIVVVIYSKMFFCKASIVRRSTAAQFLTIKINDIYILNSYSDGGVTQHFTTILWDCQCIKEMYIMSIHSIVTHTVDWGCHINMYPYTREIKAQVSTNEESCTRALGITPILYDGTIMS